MNVSGSRLSVTAASPGHGVHEEEIIVRRAGVLAVVHVFLLGGILDVFNDKLHLFTQVGFRLKNENTTMSQSFSEWNFE